MLFEELADYYGKLEGTSSRLAMIDLLTEIFSRAKKSEVRDIIYMTLGTPAPPFRGIDLGIAEKLAEEAIAAATGGSKESVDKNFKKTGDLGSSAEQLIGAGRLRRMGSEKFEVSDVMNTMLKIAETGGVGSKDAKIRMLANLLAASKPIEARYIIRFALGQLRLGAGDATILEALSKAATGDREFKPKLEDAYNICSDLGLVGETLMLEGKKGIENFRVTLFEPIRPALAERLPTAEEILERMHGSCAVESKYDGLRAQVHIDAGAKRVEIFSRRLERLTDMFPEITRAALREVHAKKAIIEGEAIAYDETTNQFHPFQETMQRKRKHGIKEMSEELPLHLFAFDLMYLNGESCLEKSYSERRRLLESIVKGGGTIRLSDRILVDRPEALEKYFDEAIESGLEGIVAKDLEAPYIAGARKFSWIKMKRSYKGELSDTVDLVAVGYYRGKGIRTEFGFGGILAAVYDDKRDMFETVTRIGTGFTEEMMRSFKGIFEKIKTGKKPARVDSLIEPDFWVEPRYVVTVKADEITKSPMHTAGRHREGEGEVGYALRFPRIVGGGIRQDKSPEDATTAKEIEEMFRQQRKTKISEAAP